MENYYTSIQVYPEFIENIKLNIKFSEYILNTVQTQLLNVIEPYFEIIDYELVNTNKFTVDKSSSHIMIVGLSPEMVYDSTQIVLYLPVNETNSQDYNTIISSEDVSLIYQVFKKYNITCFNTSQILEQKKIIKENINKASYDSIPSYIRNLNGGKSIIIPSTLYFSIETTFNYSKNNEYLILFVEHKDKRNQNLKNIIELSSTLKKEPSINQLSFQIINFIGSYNYREVKHQYITYSYFDIDVFKVSNTDSTKLTPNKLYKLLQQIYDEIKQKNNRKYREEHIRSELLDYRSTISNQLIDDISDISDNIYDINIDKIKALYTINNFVLNTNLELSTRQIQHVQTVVNTWEENGHGMLSFRDEIYDETTKLECDVYILFGVYNDIT